MAKKIIKHISDIFDGEISYDISSSGTRILNDHDVYRDIYDPADQFTITFKAYNEETNNDDTIAFIKLNLFRYTDIDTAVEYIDEVGYDEMDAVQYVSRYLDQLKEDEDIEAATLHFQICELHNFYVSPKFRGKGVSEALTLRLPQIIEEIAPYDTTYISTYINPFNEQKEISEADALTETGFGGYVGKSNAQNDIKEAAKKSLKRCGFRDVGDDHYVADCDEIIETARQNDVFYDIMFPTHDYKEIE